MSAARVASACVRTVAPLRSTVGTTAAAHRFAARTATPARRWMSFKYAPSHEYVKVDGDHAQVGITDFAQQALGDVVYVDLPEVDASYDKGESFASVESVKAASDVYLPVSGTVTEVNERLSGETNLVNTSPTEDGWFVKIKISDPSELDQLMDEAAYKKHCEDSKH